MREGVVVADDHAGQVDRDPGVLLDQVAEQGSDRAVAV